MNHKEIVPIARLFDLDIQALTFNQACKKLEGIADLLPSKATHSAKIVVTPNVDHIVRLSNDLSFKQLYAKADFIFADGMPVVWSSHLLKLKSPLPERVTGADLFVHLCQRAIIKNWPVFILGGCPGDEPHLYQHFSRVYPGLRVKIFSPSMKFDPHGEEAAGVMETINAFKPRIVFACVGMPKQEYWAFKYAPHIEANLILCVGAAMELALGLKVRAPKWIQNIGFEWLWRLLSDPKRLWRRYLIQDMQYLKLLWQEWRK
jgi:N-acetylglucosaminyldiphosphoundecaprenol N-acetyl-beta-D-mannosaminyltransferase